MVGFRSMDCFLGQVGFLRSSRSLFPGQAFLAMVIFLANIGSVSGQTVTGAVEKATSDYILVDGTRFSVDNKTQVRLAPFMITDIDGQKIKRYKPGLLGDSPIVKVEAQGRRARAITVVRER